ncbi:MAG TPA: class F sortase [Candidatus Paceibacterota bacterium]
MIRNVQGLLALAISAAALGYGVLLLVRASTYALPEAVSAPPSAAPAVGAGDIPVRIIIPTISVDAPIEKAGLVAGNRMQTPRKFADAAWFAYGSVPGREGDAVIAGHKDNGLGLSGVFKHLDDLAPGDEVNIVMQSGKTITFLVTATSSYPYDAPIPGLFSTSGAARLSLITCDGSWIDSMSEGMTYDRRLIVEASMNAM